MTPCTHFNCSYEAINKNHSDQVLWKLAKNLVFGYLHGFQMTSELVTFCVIAADTPNTHAYNSFQVEGKRKITNMRKWYKNCSALNLSSYRSSIISTYCFVKMKSTSFRPNITKFIHLSWISSKQTFEQVSWRVWKSSWAFSWIRAGYLDWPPMSKFWIHPWHPSSKQVFRPSLIKIWQKIGPCDKVS